MERLWESTTVASLHSNPNKREIRWNSSLEIRWNSFVRNQSLRNDEFLVVKRSWKGVVGDACVINIYVPQVEDKKSIIRSANGGNAFH